MARHGSANQADVLIRAGMHVRLQVQQSCLRGLFWPKLDVKITQSCLECHLMMQLVLMVVVVVAVDSGTAAQQPHCIALACTSLHLAHGSSLCDSGSRAN